MTFPPLLSVPNLPYSARALACVLGGTYAVFVGPAAAQAPSGSCPFEQSPGAPEVTDVRFEPGSAYLTDEQLARIVDDAVGCRLGAAGRRQLAEAVNALYAGQDVALAFARVPEPPADPARPTVQLVEIRYGDIRIEGAADTDEAFLRQRIGALAGEVADLTTLERRLEALAELEGLIMQADMAPGAEPGETDLTLNVAEEPEPWLGVLSLSNDGAEATGTEQLSATLVRRSLTGHRDPVTLSATKTRGAESVLLGYSRPFGAAGIRFDGSGSWERTEIIDDSSVVEGLTVESVSGRFGATVPVRARRDMSVSLNANVSRYVEQTEFRGIELQDESGIEGGFGGQLLFRQDWGAASISPSIAQGRYEDAVFDTDNRYLRFFGGAQAFVRLFDRFGLVNEASWQISSEAVPSTFAFDVTGPASIRGYPSEALTTDQGAVWRTTLEDLDGLDVPVRQGSLTLYPYLFADVGAGWDRQPVSVLDGDALASVGIGLRNRVLMEEDGATMTLDLTLGLPLVDSTDGEGRGDPRLDLSFTLTF